MPLWSELVLALLTPVCHVERMQEEQSKGFSPATYFECLRLLAGLNFSLGARRTVHELFAQMQLTAESFDLLESIVFPGDVPLA